MTSSIQLRAITALAVFFAVIVVGLIVYFVRQRRRRGRGDDARRSQADHERSIALEERLAPLTAAPEVRRATIVDQMDAVEQLTKRQVRDLLALMVDTSDGQALINRIEELSEQRRTHLRILARRGQNGLSADEALRTTLKVYSLTDLMLALDHQLIEQSEVVSHVLNDWFTAQRGISVSEFEAQLHLDAARVLLLDLDYARPSVDVVLNQLALAEKHCRAAWMPGESASSPSHTLLAEITLRRRRLQPAATEKSTPS